MHSCRKECLKLFKHTLYGMSTSSFLFLFYFFIIVFFSSQLQGRIFTRELKTLAVRREPARVIDSFPFFNELEMLRVRLEELAPVVDKFILGVRYFHICIYSSI
jgi:hypothetical protein